MGTHNTPYQTIGTSLERQLTCECLLRTLPAIKELQSHQSKYHDTEEEEYENGYNLEQRTPDVPERTPYL